MAMKDISDAQVCMAALSHGDRPCHEFLSEMTGQCEKVCWLALERADNRGLIECGIGLHRPWITSSGYSLLGMEPPPRAKPLHRNQESRD